MPNTTLASFIRSKEKASGIIGELARAAAKDAGFPREGGLAEISRVLNQRGAPAEFHEALEEAEAEWRSLQ